MAKDKALQKAIFEVGGQAELGRLLGINRQAVQSWTRAPKSRVLRIEAVTGVPCWELRPDIYPPSRFGNDKGKSEGEVGGKKGRAAEEGRAGGKPKAAGGR